MQIKQSLTEFLERLNSGGEPETVQAIGTYRANAATGKVLTADLNRIAETLPPAASRSWALADLLEAERA